MKILTVCIICNDENNMVNRIVDSCLLLKDDVELLILGEEDNPMMKEARYYAATYPKDVRVYTSSLLNALQIGIEKANGLYFKVMDNKDILETSALVKVVETFKDLLRIQANLDMMICDYEYPRKKKKRNIVEYGSVFPLDKVFQWHQIKNFKTMQKINIEAIIVKTNIVKKIEFHFPYNQYIQELLVLRILPCIKSMYYLDESLHQITIDKYKNQFITSLQEYHILMNEVVDITDITNTESRKFRNYITNHINSLLFQFFITCVKENTINSRIHREEVIEYMIIENATLYRALKKSTLFKLYTSDSKLPNLILAKRYGNI